MYLADARRPLQFDAPDGYLFTVRGNAARADAARGRTSRLPGGRRSGTSTRAAGPRCATGCSRAGLLRDTALDAAARAARGPWLRPAGDDGVVEGQRRRRGHRPAAAAQEAADHRRRARRRPSGVRGPAQHGAREQAGRHLRAEEVGSRPRHARGLDRRRAGQRPGHQRRLPDGAARGLGRRRRRRLQDLRRAAGHPARRQQALQRRQHELRLDHPARRVRRVRRARGGAGHRARLRRRPPVRGGRRQRVRGSEDPNPYEAPAGTPHVFTAAASTQDDTRATFSNVQPYNDVAAPGEELVLARPAPFGAEEGGCDPTNQWCQTQGTSFSSPLVAGAAALVWSARPSLNVGQVEGVLRSSARDVGPAGYDNQTGYGILARPLRARRAGTGGGPDGAERGHGARGRRRSSGGPTSSSSARGRDRWRGPSSPPST